MFRIMLLSGLFAGLFSVSVFAGMQSGIPEDQIAVNWTNTKSWITAGDGKSMIDLSFNEKGNFLTIKYKLLEGWVICKNTNTGYHEKDMPLEIIFKISPSLTGKSFMEPKFRDSDGSVFIRRFLLKGNYTNWSRIVFSLDDLEYTCCGKDKYFSTLKEVEIGFAGNGSGDIYIKKMGFGTKGEPSIIEGGAVIDPDARLDGYGFRQRRSRKMNPEDPLVYEWLKYIQDNSSTEKDVLPSNENNELQTFNNALVAMAFILKGDRQRAERVLDFFARATIRTNKEKLLQNFFYNGEARGFFQSVDLNNRSGAKKYYNRGKGHRWMGDMVWLYYAYEYYRREYRSDKYQEIMKLIKDLLISWYIEDPASKGGYLRHGWRNGDKVLHESEGHQEGNIDAYALFILLGDKETAGKIKIWVDSQLEGGKSFPLDLYTWRVLAYGREYKDLLNIPDYDLRFRKKITADGKETWGFYNLPVENVNNIWLDGLGHIACAYITSGDKERGYFYADQMDNLIIKKEIKGIEYHTLPYTANRSGGYNWVDPKKGFISVCAWYIFAKNGFNPMTLEKTEVQYNTGGKSAGEKK